MCLPSRDPFRGGSRRIRESTAEEQVLREEGGLAGRAGRVILTGFGRPCALQQLALMLASLHTHQNLTILLLSVWWLQYCL